MATAYGAPQQSVYPESYVGFDSITKQIEKKLVKRGFQFNIICVGTLLLLLLLLRPRRPSLSPSL